MACFNVNTKEYKALEDKYKDKMIVDALITNYQAASKNDLIPSVLEVEDLLADRKAYFSLEKQNFEKSLYGNLKKRGLIAKVGGRYFVQNTPTGEMNGNMHRAKYNYLLMRNYLLHHGFEDYIRIEETKSGKTYEVFFDDSLFNPQDIIAESPYSSNKKSKVKPSSTKVKKGVASIFEQTPELSNIGTEGEYSAYLDTVFPNSKVKSIVYHGSDSEINSFESNKAGSKKENGIFFTDSKNASSTYGKNVYPVLVNINSSFTGYEKIFNSIADTEYYKTEGLKDLQDRAKGVSWGREREVSKSDVANVQEAWSTINPETPFDPTHIEEGETYWNIETAVVSRNTLAERRLKAIELNGVFFHQNSMEQAFKEATAQGRDSITVEGMVDEFNWNIATNYDNLVAYKSTQYAILNPKNIYRLGSKKDIEGFKKFVKQPQATETNILQLVDELVSKFPGVSIEVMSVAQAEYFLNLLPVDARPTKLQFKKVKSFYYDGKAVLIKGRITKDTAVEEVLHPFIESLFLDNQELFKNLHREARRTFPVLNQQIKDTYKRGYSEKVRALELVTQALVRHFNKEYESKPNRAWYNNIIEFLKWFKDIVGDYYRKYVGQGLPLKTEYINSTATLSDIAKILNTDQLRFDLIKNVSPTVMFSLTPQAKSNLDAIKKHANPTQVAIVENLFNNLKSDEFEHDILGLNRITLEDGKYKDIDDADIKFKSTEEIILGNTDSVNRKIRTDFHTLLTGLTTQTEVEDLSFDYFNDQAAKRLMGQLSAIVHGYGLHDDRSVFVPNVVIGNSENGIADTIDLLKVDVNGVVTPISLSISGLSSFSTAYSQDIISTESELFEKGVSTKILNDTRSALQRRLLENMGYKLAENSLVINVNAEGNTHTIEGITPVKSTVNKMQVENIAPLDIDSVEQTTIEEILEMEQAPEAKEDFLTEEEALPENEEDLSYDTYDALFKALSKFDKGLMTSEEVFTNTMSYISMDKGKQELMEEISVTRAMIAEVYEDPEKVKKIYTDVIRQSLRAFESFKDYATDPDNYGKPEYINKILGMQKFIESYRGLINLDASSGLSKNQLLLKNKLQTALNELVGIRNPEGLSSEMGILDASIRNYVRALVKSKSQRDFTEEELNEIMTTAKDIGVVSEAVSDMNTSDDPISALMAKIWKRDRQIVLDRVARRAPRIKSASLKLKKLGNEDFMWMIETDENGVPTGRYVKEIGKQYYEKRKALRDKLYDEKGKYKAYRLIDPENLDKAKSEDIAYNKQLFQDKRDYRDYMKAERTGVAGPRDGKFHRYSQKFKDAREKHEVWFQESGSEYGYWVRRNSVSDKNWNDYIAKHYDSFDYEKAITDSDGVPTGSVVISHMRAPKQTFREIRKRAADGTEMRSDQWLKLHDPKTELERAQLEFYQMWMDVYEGELLNKLPDNIRMLGRLPVMEGVQMKGLKNKSTIVGRMWASMKRGTSNLINPTIKLKKTFTDEYGNIITDSLPLMYVGSIRTEQQLIDIQNQIDAANTEYAQATTAAEKNKINKKLKVLRGEQNKIESRPEATNLNLNLDEVLLKFSAMAENYEVMSQAEDTYTAMMKVIKDRSEATYDEDGNLVPGEKTKEESRRYRRARKWMKMTYYGNDQDTLNFFEKMTKGLINQTSLAYVGFNVFGNLNNYLFGRMSNSIETLGSRHFDGSQMVYTLAEFNGRALQDVFSRLAEMTDSNSKWKPANFSSKYLASVDFFRMLDDKSDLREQTKGDKESLWRRLTNWGFFLQDAGEFNVQSKVGNVIVRSHTAINSKTGETKSLYDALIFNRETGALEMEEGYDQVQMYGRDKIMEWNDDAKYEIRNNIREVNKIIHGNYAYEDRMVIQAHALGQLAAQFHKWVVPSIQTRFRPEYFDENLGWVEGRYLSFWNFMSYFYKNINELGSIHENYKKHHGVKGKQKLQNAYRTIGELGLFMTTIIIRNLLVKLFADDDDDSEVKKKLENVLIYQADRLRKELVTFNPVPGMGGYQQMMQLFKSPIAATRTLGELGEAMEVTVGTGLSYAFLDDEAFFETSYVYKRGNRKGKMKLGKEWGDALPILYTINRWKGYERITDFYIK